MVKSYTQEDINNTLSRVSDIYLDYKEPTKSYMYIKGQRKVMYIKNDEEKMPIILDFFRNVKDLCEKSPTKQDHTVVFLGIISDAT
jgi:hypothetical protein